MREIEIYSLFYDLKGYYNIASKGGKNGLNFHNYSKSGILKGVVGEVEKNHFYNIGSFQPVW